MSRGVEKLDCAKGDERDCRDRGAPGIVAREHHEEHQRLEQTDEDERIPEADQVGAKHAKRGRVEEADVAGVHVLHLEVQRFPFQNPLCYVGVVPFVGRIPEPVVVAVEQPRGRQHRDDTGEATLGHHRLH